jgi:hypothetical protein
MPESTLSPNPVRNFEFDLCIRWLRPRNPLLLAFGILYEGAIGQPTWTTSLCDPLVLMFPHLQRVDGFAGGARQGLLLDRHRQKVRDRQEDRHN